jgi:hypothetical protein
MDLQPVTELNAKFRVSVVSRPGTRAGGGFIYFDLYGMPPLSYFVALAEAYGVPVDNITVESYDASGCETCGPDIRIHVTVRRG